MSLLRFLLTRLLALAVILVGLAVAAFLFLLGLGTYWVQRLRGKPATLSKRPFVANSSRPPVRRDEEIIDVESTPVSAETGER